MLKLKTHSGFHDLFLKYLTLTFERQKKTNKNYQFKPVPNLNPKQQTDLVNNFPSQMSS